MSMICWLLRVSPKQILAMRANPDLAADLALFAQNEQQTAKLAELMSRMPPERRKAFENTALFEDPTVAGARTRLESIGPFEQALDLEKSWHILHYLFTGEIGPSTPPADALLSGEELGRDMGYGSARLLSPAQVGDFARFLGQKEIADLRTRVNYGELMQARVYGLPMGQGSETQFEEELRAEVAGYFPLLRDYVSQSSGKGCGLLTWIS